MFRRRRHAIADVIEFLIDIAGSNARPYAAWLFDWRNAITEIIVKVHRPALTVRGVAVAAIIAVLAQRLMPMGAVVIRLGSVATIVAGLA